MSDFFKKNMDLLKNKNSRMADVLMQTDLPESAQSVREREKTSVIRDVHLNSCYDSKREAEFQVQLIPEQSAVAHVYGISNGAVQNQLLARSALKQLYVHVMNPQVCKTVFTYFDHSAWLADERTSIDFPKNNDKVHAPFAVVFPCVLLADASLNALKDRLILELNTPFTNRMMQNEIIDWPKRLKENESIFASDPDIAELFDTVQDQSITVAGGGPTLSDHFNWIKQHRKKIKLIAVNTALKSLVAEKIIPDIVVVIDPRDMIEKYFEMDLSLLKKTSLVYFPGILNSILEKWPGKRFGAYPQKLYDPLKAWMEQIPKGRLFSAGSVIHPSIDLAVKMGAGEVILLGADFSYPKGRTHVAGAALEKVITEKEIPVHYVLNEKNEKVPSRPDLIGFLRDLEIYIDKHPTVKFVNGSRDGAAIRGTEYLD